MEGSKSIEKEKPKFVIIEFQSNLNNGRLKKPVTPSIHCQGEQRFQSNLNNGRLKKLEAKKDAMFKAGFQSNLNNGRLKKQQIVE